MSNLGRIKQLTLALTTFFLMGAYADPCGGDIGDPCDVDADCRADYLCLEGTCQEPGTCVCTEEYAPVCGVDGETYGNACMARCADVEIDHTGPCEPICPPVFCDLYCPDGFAVGEDGCPICECVDPDPCRSNADCEPDDVCIDGECGPPCNIACFRYDPVCGEDGVTYACGFEDAYCHGVEVAHEGECDCICTAEYAPVCGVDGETYGNACRARCAGVEVAYVGECRDECRSNEDCPDDQICYPPTDTCQPACEIACFRYDPVCERDGVTYGCGAPDAHCHGVEVAYEGECGCMCTDEWAPVCGVDGETYGNACEAECAGVAILHIGQCNDDCPEVLCDLWCPRGFQLGEDGCPICECVPECEPVVCLLACEYGFRTGPDGCEVCECADPPKACLSNDECREGQRCDLENFCLSPPGCGPDEYCPTVCYGACVDR